MHKATGLVLLGVCSVSVSAPMVKLALMAGATPVTVAFLRMGVTALVLGAPALRGGALAGMLRAPWKWKGLAVLASLFLALHYAAWMTSLQKTGTFASVALVCAQPLFVAIFSALLLREPIQRQAIPGAITAMAGAVGIGLLSATGRGGDLLGDLLAFSGAITMAGHWLCSRAVRRHVPAMGYLVFVYACTALLLGAALPFMGGFSAPAASLPYIGVLIAVCTLAGHALFTYALGFVSADLISFALLGEPIGAAAWAWFLFGEEVGWPMMLGGGLVLAGLAWYLLGVRRAALHTEGVKS